MLDKRSTKDVKEIFSLMLIKKFPVRKVIPIIKYEWNDIKSMSDDNSSAFNYIIITKNALSPHAHGQELDLNPFENPYIKVKSVLHLKH